MEQNYGVVQVSSNENERQRQRQMENDDQIEPRHQDREGNEEKVKYE